MDDMFDTVGMASRLLYRMREQRMDVPLFFILGGYNPLMQKHNVDLLSCYAQELGIKSKNLRAYYNTASMKDKLAVLKEALPGKTVVFVTSRLFYEPLKAAVDAAGCPFTAKYHVAHETLEDALGWVNANAAGNRFGPYVSKLAGYIRRSGFPKLFVVIKTPRYGTECVSNYPCFYTNAGLRLKPLK